tara:strand:+ start:1131 stop:1511 length:381 start_codon:yes stop_codon:yes gene_type:complete
MSERTRIIFKRDSESSIGRGAIIYHAHFRPEISVILYWAAFHAPNELNGEMWVTEGWRNIRESRDLHKECRAFDLDCTRIEAKNYLVRYKIAQRWANLLTEELGPDYQVILHAGEKALHLHVELDP